MKVKPWTWLVVVFLALGLTLMTVKKTVAYFVSKQSLEGELYLRSGTLFLANMPSQTFTFDEETRRQTVTLPVQNQGTLAGEFFVESVVARLGESTLSGKELAEYVTVEYKQLVQPLASQETTNYSFSIEKKKPWSSQTPLVLSIHLKLKQVGTAIGFTDQKVFRLVLNHQEALPSEDWPVDDLFQDSIYMAQNLLYGLVDEYITTIVPGILYYQVKEGKILTAKEQDSVIKHLKDKGKDKNQNKYHFLNLEYIPKKGFRAVIEAKKIKEASPNRHTSLGYTLDWHDFLGPLTIDNFGIPLFIDNDVFETVPKVDRPIIVEQETVVSFFLYEITSDLNSLKELVDLTVFLEEQSLKVVLTGKQADDFAFEWETPHSRLRLKQTSTSGNSTAWLQLVHPQTGKVVFQRKIVSQKQELDSKTDTSLEERKEDEKDF